MIAVASPWHGMAPAVDALPIIGGAGVKPPLPRTSPRAPSAPPVSGPGKTIESILRTSPPSGINPAVLCASSNYLLDPLGPGSAAVLDGAVPRHYGLASKLGTAIRPPSMEPPN